MWERAMKMGATLTIESVPGQGTSLNVRTPLGVGSGRTESLPG
jgi:signal transduction histidine kinase